MGQKLPDLRAILGCKRRNVLNIVDVHDSPSHGFSAGDSRPHNLCSSAMVLRVSVLVLDDSPRFGSQPMPEHPMTPLADD